MAMALTRAVRLHLPTRTLRLAEVERPRPGPGEVLVKVKAAGVCQKLPGQSPCSARKVAAVEIVASRG